MHLCNANFKYRYDVKNDLKNKVVLIAGGAKNLGGLLSRDFAAKGAKLAIHYNSDATKADAEKRLQMFRQQELRHFVSGDLTKVENITKLFDETISDLVE